MWNRHSDGLDSMEWYREQPETEWLALLRLNDATTDKNVIYRRDRTRKELQDSVRATILVTQAFSQVILCTGIDPNVRLWFESWLVYVRVLRPSWMKKHLAN